MFTFNFLKSSILSTIIGLICCTVIDCGATTLGDIDGAATIDHPLNVSVRVNVESINFAQKCFAVKVVFNDTSVPATLIFEESNTIRITTTAKVTEHFVHIYLSSICENNYTKHYVLSIPENISRQNIELGKNDNTINNKNITSLPVFHKTINKKLTNKIEPAKIIPDKIPPIQNVIAPLTQKENNKDTQSDIDTQFKKPNNSIADISDKSKVVDISISLLSARFDILENQVTRNFIYLLVFLGVLVLIVFVFISSIIFGKRKFDEVIIQERTRNEIEQKNMKRRIERYKEYVRTRQLNIKQQNTGLFKFDEVDVDLGFLDTGIGE